MKRCTYCILLVILCLSGCVSKKSTVELTSIKDGISMKNKISNLFVVIDLEDNESYSVKLAQNLKEQLNIQNVKCETYIKTKLDLNSGKEWMEMANNEGASHILHINLFSQYTDMDYHRTSKTITLNIYDLKDGSQHIGFLSQDLRMIKKANQAKTDAQLIVEEFNKNNLLK